MVVANRYAEQSRIFLRQAYEELEQGDLHQASEKGWGAVAQIVKAVAEDRGLDHKGHMELFAIVRSLVGETGDNDLSIAMQLANSLHINFYEGWLGHEDIDLALGRISGLVEKLEALPSRA